MHKTDLPSNCAEYEQSEAVVLVHTIMFGWAGVHRYGTRVVQDITRYY